MVISTELLTQVAGCTEMTVIPVSILSEIHDDRRLHDVYRRSRRSHKTRGIDSEWRVQFYLLLLQMFVLWDFIATPQNKHLKQ